MYKNHIKEIIELYTLLFTHLALLNFTIDYISIISQSIIYTFTSVLDAKHANFIEAVKSELKADVALREKQLRLRLPNGWGLMFSTIVPNVSELNVGTEVTSACMQVRGKARD